MEYNKFCFESLIILSGPVAQLGERTVRIREVRGFDPLRVHQIGNHRSENCGDFSFDHINTTDGFQKIDSCDIIRAVKYELLE